MDPKTRRLIAALEALPRESPSAGFDAAVLAALEPAPAVRLPAWVGPA
ncbi:MAG: hypothetical protein HY079_04855, partial [Elusimicrobia bacterium]|nr:hypothetical protein [Elusimicrobiota bacterium]